MTIEQIKDRVEHIRTIADDDEMAHVAEKELLSDFVEYVASLDNASLAEKARAVLSTKDIRFSRWFA